MTRNPYKLITLLLQMAAIVLVANVGTSCADDKADTKALIAKAEQYEFGRGVPQDSKEAAKWYRKAAEQGNASAQYWLGLVYASGEEVPQDYKEAVKWYRKAAEQGHVSAQRFLGVRYEYGEGVPKDAVNAYAWYNVASANGKFDASNERELMAKTMTPEQIAEAQKLSREWFEKYQPKKN